MRRFLPATLVCVLFSVSTLHAAVPQSERDALIGFFNAAGGNQWTDRSGWNGAPGSECSWRGVICDDAGEHVAALELSNNAVSAVGATSLLGLTRLVTLDLSGNHISGTLPPQLGALTELRMLNLTDNRFSGPIPAEWVGLVKMDTLLAGSNQLSGSLPSFLGDLPQLKVIDLYDNHFTGAIPDSFTHLSGLIELNLSVNQISGSIPSGFGSMQSLLHVTLTDNQLAGSIPRDLGNARSLEVLDLGHNQLTGGIPSELAALSALNEFEVAGNPLGGEIPAWLFTLPELRYAFLAECGFSGSIPATLSGAVKLSGLDLSGNMLGGELPSLAALRSMTYLSLNDNNLTGNFPAIEQMPELIEARLANNDLSGTLPSLTNLTKLKTLLVAQNHLSGELPASISSLRSMSTLSLGGNRFSGALPSALGSLTGLTYLDLGSNQFSGEVPFEMTSLVNLVNGEGLNLDYNLLSSSDARVRDFLTAKSGRDWTLTQTTTPTNVQVGSVTDRSAIVSWSLIPYSLDDGGYEVYASTTPGGRPEVTAAAPWKGRGEVAVRGLRPSTNYFFSVRAFTEPHDAQQSTLRSPFSPAVQASTTQRVIAPAEVVVTTRPRGLVEVGGVAQNTDSFVLTNIGDVATDVSLAPTDNFFDIAPRSFTIAAGATQVVTITAIPQIPGTYGGEVIAQGVGIATDFWVEVRLVSVVAPSGDVIGEAVASRVDFSGEPNSVSNGVVSFRNNGTATLHGVVLADQPWLVVPVTPVSIDPGSTANIPVTVDRRKRTSVEASDGTATANIALLYGDLGNASLARALTPAAGTNLGFSVSLVTVVDTAKPPVSADTPPGLAGGEIAYFAPTWKLQRLGSNFITDLNISNSYGSTSVADLKLFFRNGGTGATNATSLGALGFGDSINLANIVSSVYGSTAAGSVQLRSIHSQDLTVAARLVDVGRSGGTVGGSLPVFRSDRGAGAGQSSVLAGVRKDATTHSDIEIQEMGGASVSVTIDFLDANGAAVGAARKVEVAPFGLADLNDAVPAGTATAVVTTDASSAGRIAAQAVVTDHLSGDNWSIVDWRRYYDLLSADSLRVPIARSAGSAGGRGRPVRRITATAAASVRTRTTLALFNAGTVRADGVLSYRSASGTTLTHRVEVTAKHTLFIDDLASLFGRSGSEAATVVYVPDHGSLYLTARIVTTGGAGAVGTAIPVTAATAGLRNGESRDFVALETSDRASIAARTAGSTRTSFGLVETSGQSVTVRASMLISGKNDLAATVYSRDFNLAAGAMLLFDDVAAALAGSKAEQLGALHNVHLRFQVVDGDGAAAVFVEPFDNGNGDSYLITP